MCQAVLSLTVEPSESAQSLAMQNAFFADIAARYPGWQPASSQAVNSNELAPPNGVWLIACLDGQAVGCGGLQRLSANTAEIRRIFIDGQARGRGIGRALLNELESRGRLIGYQHLRLTTGDQQPEALRLFESAGYIEIPPFTSGAFTRHWMEKTLTSYR
jgi:GNAT superfamily N-acetyltransferase